MAEAVPGWVNMHGQTHFHAFESSFLELSLKNPNLYLDLLSSGLIWSDPTPYGPSTHYR